MRWMRKSNLELGEAKKRAKKAETLQKSPRETENDSKKIRKKI